jgi:hypothetical protein
MPSGASEARAVYIAIVEAKAHILQLILIRASHPLSTISTSNEYMEARDKSGVVYLITAPPISVCKIGYWKGSLSNLRNRYLVPYGRAMDI